jgi:hypothetical protein
MTGLFEWRRKRTEERLLLARAVSMALIYCQRLGVVQIHKIGSHYEDYPLNAFRFLNVMIHIPQGRSCRLFHRVPGIPATYQVCTLSDKYFVADLRAGKNLFESEDGQYRVTIIRLEHDTRFSVHPLQPKLE